MRIAILTGGTSSEREIALKSAANVAAAFASDNQVETFDFPTDLDRFIVRRNEFRVAVPIFHGRGGEDGDVQGFLKTLDVPFIFSDVEAQALAIDKPKTKVVVASVGLRVPHGRIVVVGDVMAYEHPVVVKPPDAGSSVGASIAHSQEELDSAMANAFAESSCVLVEDYVRGDEFTVAVVQHQGELIALPVIQIKSKNAFFDLESKYDPSLAEEICPAPISDELAEKLQHAALLAHRAVGARHVSRADFIVDADGVIWFLEINTIPGMTNESLLPKAIRAGGLEFGDLLREWIAEVIHT